MRKETTYTKAFTGFICFFFFCLSHQFWECLVLFFVCIFLLYRETGGEGLKFWRVCFCVSDWMGPCVSLSLCHVPCFVTLHVDVCVCAYACAPVCTPLPHLAFSDPPIRTVTPYTSPWSASLLSDASPTAPLPSRPSRHIWRTAASLSSSSRCISQFNEGRGGCLIKKKKMFLVVLSHLKHVYSLLWSFWKSYCWTQWLKIISNMKKIT